ncbi:hypothetical protein A3H89_03015 [Candidatus Amesbacteria bacterium RIFCSPLOWO2_02_FULL_48_11]|uniref:Uncharacterized protein n=4 Tax=Candidatus Amesiibacteriota TaxID=1752730 RepID=A0A1F4Z816_9BACT|nr:MAG: hypothetical protein UX78_C0005G0046 [Candidatus Amesbacteria bacterium GW2011_GWA2_47_11]OGC96224.1 MAG: hypothetical protein A3C34_02480 [Candidatus Amesbacteria bacterium RIFCSPHIGHO2_02_FULL_48_21]OGD02390.1 MAG: hypothetical protein A3E17_04845 [Candidatus Amesbacteria bacterium RIFCSPHIGHO2_12_FULL_48_14]OGD02473.1 MAG: hypothetical protein A2354_01870 [Candidatus Amesbacteria bacterium RIFOXYB1_FULL_47_12]OGD06381.1 MAG: hypothetical protein A3B58_01120 [Candidatus Amesbacteria b
MTVSQKKLSIFFIIFVIFLVVPFVTMNVITSYLHAHYAGTQTSLGYFFDDPHAQGIYFYVAMILYYYILPVPFIIPVILAGLFSLLIFKLLKL